MYNAEDLIESLRKRPFESATLTLSSGETFVVRHPEQVLVTDTDGVIITVPGDRPGRVRWRLVGLDHIQGIELAGAN